VFYVGSLPTSVPSSPSGCSKASFLVLARPLAVAHALISSTSLSMVVPYPFICFRKPTIQNQSKAYLTPEAFLLAHRMIIGPVSGCRGGAWLLTTDPFEKVCRTYDGWLHHGIIWMAMDVLLLGYHWPYSHFAGCLFHGRNLVCGPCPFTIAFLIYCSWIQDYSSKGQL
jgi:hypothetical protein